jgi:hypothetical protein
VSHALLSEDTTPPCGSAFWVVAAAGISEQGSWDSGRQQAGAQTTSMRNLIFPLTHPDNRSF